MSEKIEALIERLEDIISNLDFEPLKKLFKKLHLDSLLNINFSEKFILKAFLSIVAFIAVISIAVTISEVTNKPEDETTIAETTEAVSSVFSESKNEINGNFLFLLINIFFRAF